MSKSKPAFLAFIFGLSAALLTFAQTPPSHPAATHPGSTPHASPATLSEARQTSVVKYIRERFGVAGNVKLTFGEIKQSNVSPAYLDSILTISDGTNSHQQEILVSKDGRFLIVVTGAVIDVSEATSAAEVARIREVLKMPPTLKVTLSPFKPAASLEFRQATMNLDDGKSKQDRAVLLARDGKHLIVSDLYNMALDPRQQALHLISLRNEASTGPANAPVTIVEYADLQCPTCKRMHEFLETKIIPRYGDKVRIVFKEFPLPMHDWSFTAAIANQCAYQINPSTYLPLRTLIYRNQELINIANLRDTLLNFGEQAGLDRVQLAGCLDSKASLARIEHDQDEAKRLDVNSTPTLFINGKKMVGLPSEDAYYQLIDDALNGK